MVGGWRDFFAPFSSDVCRLFLFPPSILGRAKKEKEEFWYQTNGMTKEKIRIFFFPFPGHNAFSRRALEKLLLASFVSSLASAEKNETQRSARKKNAQKLTGKKFCCLFHLIAKEKEGKSSKKIFLGEIQERVGAALFFFLLPLGKVRGGYQTKALHSRHEAEEGKKEEAPKPEKEGEKPKRRRKEKQGGGLGSTGGNRRKRLFPFFFFLPFFFWRVLQFH